MKNNYANFISVEEIKQKLEKISTKEEIKKGGIPMCYDETSIYMDNDVGHTLVIGSTGSGKTQSITLPKLYTSILAGENIIIDDIKAEEYECVKNLLEEKGYQIFKFDFANYNGNKWNPLKLAYELYKDNNLDDAVMLLEKTAYYVFNDANNINADPFWVNSVKQLFVGTVLYILEKEDRLPNIHEISSYASKITEDDFNALNDDSPAKIFLRVIMTAPPETKGSIFTVFNNSIMCYAYANKITEFLSDTDFEITDLLKEKTALFIFDGHKKSYITNLISLFIEELYYVCNKNHNTRKINILLDDFQDYGAVEDFTKLLVDMRSFYIEYTILVNSLHQLNDLYGETTLEHIMSYFVRIIYLFATDEFTVEYISRMCGNKNNNDRLISTTELKLFKNFEALVLKNRQLPFKTKLLPFYQYPNK